MPDLNIIMGIVRALLPMLLAYAVGWGWISVPQSDALTGAVVVFVPAAVGLAMAVWSIKTNWKKP